MISNNVSFLALFFSISITFCMTNMGRCNVQEDAVQKTIESLVKIHGGEHTGRIEKGVRQAAQQWRKEDGSDKEFKVFCEKYFITDKTVLLETLKRYDRNLETISGHSLEIKREVSNPIQLELGPLYPVDYLFAEFDPFAHLNEDYFKTKIAFVALLNFPIYTLEDRLKLGEQWKREEWAQTRLAEKFAERIPAEAQQSLTKAYVQADDYISNYNIYMHHLLNKNGKRLFPNGLKLISHWGLRDELKAQYAIPDGLVRQKMIQKVMERIILQEIPESMIDNDTLDWAPYDNTVLKDGQHIKAESEPNTRYQHLLSIFRAERGVDPFYPSLPSKVKRRFERDREIPEKEFKDLLITVLTDPIGKDVAKLISKRLGRKLEPFDIWYNGFKPRSSFNEADLDRIVIKKYPNTGAFQTDLSDILRKLGFDAETADFLAGKIKVDPSRGVGHALGAARRADNAHLRTRIPSEGMLYKGYNIAIHEFGHTVEQVISLNKVDYTLLEGVPNTAFTEAFAYVFQSRDLELLGLEQQDPLAEHLLALDTYWSTCEIAAVGLVDINVWNWMYENPDATPETLKQAVVQIAKDVWKEYFVPLFGTNDIILLAIYSHMIDGGLYLPDYSLGHIIMFQIEQYLKDKNLAVEMERMCTLGSLTPDAWMRSAVGSPISAAPLLDATRNALKTIR